MIKFPATRVVAAVILVGGLAVTPLLDDDESGDFAASNAPVANPRAAQDPLFQIHWQQGELTLSGHTASLRHEQDLLQVAATSYPENLVLTDFRPLGIVPGSWEDTTIQILYLLAETASAQAELSVDEITIRSVAVDELAWRSRLDALRKALHPGLTINTDTLFVDPALNVLEVCARAFETFDSGPINFEESSTKFRSSAYPRLDRVIALANACSSSRVTVTGHTDSSGAESLNQRLSLMRANAVRDYIVKGGVDPERLQVSGLGSAVPIADDSTRYGRSLNRRIEITLGNNDGTAAPR